MNDFISMGFWHVINRHAYDHLLYLWVMMLPFVWADWRRWLLLVSVFTAGHTLSLLLAVIGVVHASGSWVEPLILFSILAGALLNLVQGGKSNNKKWWPWTLALAGFFGLVHGLGFSDFFVQVLPGDATDKLGSLLYFTLGVEGGQLLVVLGVLLLNFTADTLLPFSRREWVLMVSAFVLGIGLCLLQNMMPW